MSFTAHMKFLKYQNVTGKVEDTSNTFILIKTSITNHVSILKQ